jgi:excisionase family DNA binding protein
MLDDNQQRALCEYLDREFLPEAQAISNSVQRYPPVCYPVTEIPEETRQWGEVRWSGMQLWHSHDDPEDWGWAGKIYGQRSDGQFFYVVMAWRPHRDREDPEQLLRSRFQNAVLSFNSYRDCSCGILRHDPTGKVDDDGLPETRAVLSPCAKHPKAKVADPPEKWLTVQQVADKLQLDPVTIRRYIAKEQLLAVRIGRDLRIAETDLATFLAERSNQNAT